MATDKKSDSPEYLIRRKYHSEFFLESLGWSLRELSLMAYRTVRSEGWRESFAGKASSADFNTCGAVGPTGPSFEFRRLREFQQSLWQLTISWLLWSSPRLVVPIGGGGAITAVGSLVQSTILSSAQRSGWIFWLIPPLLGIRIHGSLPDGALPLRVGVARILRTLGPLRTSLV